jgi:tRNA pseudouridine55 synthase
MNSGFIIIDKPKGITSFDVVAQLRKITGIRKIGHAGTLDPLASGVLICAIGREATKRIHEFQNQDKVYEATIEFGRESDTYDAEGKIQAVAVDKIPSLVEVEDAVDCFVGEIEQMPPIYSAKKVGGVSACRLVRRGIQVELKPSFVLIKKITLVAYQWPVLKIEVACGAGTYIRSLAHDLGEKLQVGGILIELRRTRIGKFDLSKAHQLEAINSMNWPDLTFFESMV